MDFIIGKVQHYNHKKYWKMRDYVTKSGRLRLLKIWYLYRIKSMDAYNCASFGTQLHKSAYFKTPPHLPHGPRGIFVSLAAEIGENATIFQQVTIGDANGGAPKIGDNVFIGAGAKIIGGITVGNNVKIGANCVVFEDIPDNATVVLPRPRVIIK